MAVFNHNNNNKKTFRSIFIAYLVFFTGDACRFKSIDLFVISPWNESDVAFVLHCKIYIVYQKSKISSLCICQSHPSLCSVARINWNFHYANWDEPIGKHNTVWSLHAFDESHNFIMTFLANWCSQKQMMNERGKKKTSDSTNGWAYLHAYDCVYVDKIMWQLISSDLRIVSIVSHNKSETWMNYSKLATTRHTNQATFHSLNSRILKMYFWAHFQSDVAIRVWNKG